MESKKLYGASTQMTPAVYKDFYKTYYNEKLKVFKIVAEIVGLIAIFGAFYILASHTKTQKTTVRQRTLLFLKIICRKKQNHT